MREIHDTVRPDEFLLLVVDGRIVCVEWRNEITRTEDGGWNAKVHPVERICVPATENEAKRLLMLCRYADPSAEVALMRRDIEDEERIEHEAYHSRVCEYLAAIGIGG